MRQFFPSSIGASTILFSLAPYCFRFVLLCALVSLGNSNSESTFLSLIQYSIATSTQNCLSQTFENPISIMLNSSNVNYTITYDYCVYNAGLNISASPPGQLIGVTVRFTGGFIKGLVINGFSNSSYSSIEFFGVSATAVQSELGTLYNSRFLVVGCNVTQKLTLVVFAKASSQVIFSQSSVLAEAAVRGGLDQSNFRLEGNTFKYLVFLSFPMTNSLVNATNNIINGATSNAFVWGDNSLALGTEIWWVNTTFSGSGGFTCTAYSVGFGSTLRFRGCVFNVTTSFWSANIFICGGSIDHDGTNRHLGGKFQVAYNATTSERNIIILNASTLNIVSYNEPLNTAFDQTSVSIIDSVIEADCSVQFGISTNSALFLDNCRLSKYIVNLGKGRNVTMVTRGLSATVQISYVGGTIEDSSLSILSSSTTQSLMIDGRFLNCNVLLANVSVVSYIAIAGSFALSSLTIRNTSVISTSTSKDALSFTCSWNASLTHIDNCSISTSYLHTIAVSSLIYNNSIIRITNSLLKNSRQSTPGNSPNPVYAVVGMIASIPAPFFDTGCLFEMDGNVLDSANQGTFYFYTVGSGGKVIFTKSNSFLGTGKYYHSFANSSSDNVIQIYNAPNIVRVRIGFVDSGWHRRNIVEIVYSETRDLWFSFAKQVGFTYVMTGVTSTYLEYGVSFDSGATCISCSFTLTNSKLHTLEYVDYHFYYGCLVHRNLTVTNVASFSLSMEHGTLAIIQSAFGGVGWRFSDGLLQGATVGIFNNTATMTAATTIQNFPSNGSVWIVEGNTFKPGAITTAVYWTKSPIRNTTVIWAHNNMSAGAASYSFNMDTGDNLAFSQFIFRHNNFLGTFSMFSNGGYVDADNNSNVFSGTHTVNSLAPVQPPENFVCPEIINQCEPYRPSGSPSLSSLVTNTQTKPITISTFQDITHTPYDATQSHQQLTLSVGSKTDSKSVLESQSKSSGPSATHSGLASASHSSTVTDSHQTNSNMPSASNSSTASAPHSTSMSPAASMSELISATSSSSGELTCRDLGGLDTSDTCAIMRPLPIDWVIGQPVFLDSAWRTKVGNCTSIAIPYKIWKGRQGALHTISIVAVDSRVGFVNELAAPVKGPDADNLIASESQNLLQVPITLHFPTLEAAMNATTSGLLPGPVTSLPLPDGTVNVTFTYSTAVATVRYNGGSTLNRMQYKMYCAAWASCPIAMPGVIEITLVAAEPLLPVAVGEVVSYSIALASIGSGLTTSPGAVARLGVSSSLQRMSRCAGLDLDDDINQDTYDYFLGGVVNPFGLTLGSEKGGRKYLRGTLLMSLIYLLTLSVLMFSYTTVSSQWAMRTLVGGRSSRARNSSVLALLKGYPSALVGVGSFVMDGAVAAGVGLGTIGNVWSDFMFGWVAVVISVAFVLHILWVSMQIPTSVQLVANDTSARRTTEQLEVAGDQQIKQKNNRSAKEWWRWFTAPTDRWKLNETTTSSGSRNGHRWMERNYSYIDDLRVHWYCGFEQGLTLIICILGALPFSDMNFCIARGAVSAGLLAVQSFVMVSKRPPTNRWRWVLLALVLATQTLMAALSAANAPLQDQVLELGMHALGTLVVVLLAIVFIVDTTFLLEGLMSSIKLALRKRNRERALKNKDKHSGSNGEPLFLEEPLMGPDIVIHPVSQGQQSSPSDNPNRPISVELDELSAELDFSRSSECTTGIKPRLPDLERRPFEGSNNSNRSFILEEEATIVESILKQLGEYEQSISDARYL